MPIEKTGLWYEAGKRAFAEGVPLADKPAMYLTLEWDVGWHDAHAELTRFVAAELQKPK